MDWLLVGIGIVIVGIVLFNGYRIAHIAQNKGDSTQLRESEEMMTRLMDRQREILGLQMKSTEEKINQSVQMQLSVQKDKMEDVERRIADYTKANEYKLEQMRQLLDDKLTRMEKSNDYKLEQMRMTVDEKLTQNLDKKLNESFGLISERLEAVYKGLGEMQSLANGVGDLKKVLTNVKARGTWGEVQLHNLLEQMLTKEQYVVNPAIGNSGEHVEFAIVLPGKEERVLLPIDAKFPIEDYTRLVEASEAGDAEGVDLNAKALERRIREEAKKIRTKYIQPPLTTDFALLYLPIEGLYAEVLRKNGLCESLQENFRVVVCGPTTLTALLNSLQIGFKTLAIEKRSSEIWNLLADFRTEFGKFNLLLAKTQKKLQEAANTMEDTARKTRTIERKLKRVNVDELEEEDPIQDLLTYSQEDA